MCVRPVLRLAAAAAALAAWSSAGPFAAPAARAQDVAPPTAPVRQAQPPAPQGGDGRSEPPPPAVGPDAADPNAPAATDASRRNMLWDRARRRAELARQRSDVERELARLRQTLGEDHPQVERARQRAEALTRAIRAAAAAAVDPNAAADSGGAGGAGAEIVLEKAAYLGVATSPAAPVLQKHLKLPEGVGLVVDFVEPGSPAAAAGLQPYDVLVRLERQILVNPQQLAVLVRTFEPGANVTFHAVREGEPVEVALQLVEREVKPITRVQFGDGNRVGGGAIRFHDAPPQPVPAPRPAGGGGDGGGDGGAGARAAGAFDAGDLLVITIGDLQGPGIDTTKTARIAPDGTIRLPYIETPVQAAGLTNDQLVGAVRRAYRDEKLLENTNVSVSRVTAPRPAVRPRQAAPRAADPAPAAAPDKPGPAIREQPEP
jgi:hypothetical protein